MLTLGRVIRGVRRRLPRIEPRPRFRGFPDRSIAVPFGYRPTVRSERIAVVLHIFYAEMAGEMAALCSHIPGQTDIYVSTDTAEKRRVIEVAFAVGDRARWMSVWNRTAGRDMAAKFVTFRDELASYDLLLFLHSKKSLYFEIGGDWRDVLFSALAGSEAIVESVLALFRADPRLGIVFPQHFEGIRDRLNWGANRRRAGKLAARSGFPLRRAKSFDFVSGSMFWARPAALEPLWSLGLTLEDFEAEDGQLDATIAHALERIILFGAEHAGCHWLKVAYRPLYGATADIIEVPDEKVLIEAMDRARFRLLR